MQQKEVLISVSVLLIGFLLISQTNIFSAKPTVRESNTITGAATSDCECPYKTGDVIFNPAWQQRAWEILSILGPYAEPKRMRVGVATGCLGRFVNTPCPVKTCVVVFVTEDGDDIPMEFFCRDPPTPVF